VISPQEKNRSNDVIIYDNHLYANKSIDEYQNGGRFGLVYVNTFDDF
jgi:hypothetical protein